MALKIYNSFTKQKEIFKPIVAGKVMILTPASLRRIDPFTLPSPPITISASILLTARLFNAFLK